MSEKSVTRFAPSPTGFMHIGSVRTALFAYLEAKQTEGTFILRIEDTDKAREVAGSIEHIKESLQWLGITWDYGPDVEGPFGSSLQSNRLSIYKEYAKKLIAKGLAYPDPYTQEELSIFREKAQAEKRPFLYREHRPKTFDVWDGTKPLRLKVPEVKRYNWHDEVRGDLEAGEEALDDVILIKSDGYPTYNFAHIVDDFLMGVTHVMRGDEFISSTPKFLSIYDALEIPYPKFVSLPPILGEDRTKKLGKRDGAKDILQYREDGYLPETMVNILALTGWNPGTEQEVFSMKELIQAFSIEKIQKAGASFNEEKLMWINKEHLHTVDDATYQTEVIKRIPKRLQETEHFTERFPKLLPSIRERVHIYKEAKDAAEAGEYDFAFITPDVTKELLKWKKDEDVSEALPRLNKAQELLLEADFGSPEAIKTALWDYAEAVGRGELLWPMRVALTGLERSPDPFVCAYILGKEETIARLKTACDKIVS